MHAYMPEPLKKMFASHHTNVERIPYFDDPTRIENQTKIDWHDYKFMEYEAHRKGLAEQGERVVLKHFDAILQKAIYAANGYDGYLSDRVSLFRSVKDIRHPE
jgi:polypeptide N-acetylgalactosaminyltransferase